MTGFTREINRLLAGILGMFGVVLLAAAYYAVAGQFTLLQREDNPRLVEAEQAILRGGLYDRRGELLVRTIVADGVTTRETLYPSVASATGYYSYRYGAGGAEAAYNTILSGEDLPVTASELILAQPRAGADVRLTLDLSVQQAMAEAIGARRGAGVVMTVPDGGLLALVSSPTYDPNTLDVDWNTLIKDPGEPFFNRALQGRYQPGTMLQLPVLITSMVRGQTLNVQFPSGAFPIQLDDLTLTCLLAPENSEMTLRTAYLNGCPAPFVQIAPSLGIDELRETFDLMRLEDVVAVEGFTEDVGIERTRLTRSNLRENVLGQGNLNMSPLALATFTAAVINDGNAPQARALQAYRLPNTTTWVSVRDARPTAAYMTGQNARRASEIMRESAGSGTASGVEWSDLNVGGQAGIAYSGETTLSWFTGFAVLENQANIVVTVVLEDTDDPAEAAAVARAAIRAAEDMTTLSAASS